MRLRFFDELENIQETRQWLDTPPITAIFESSLEFAPLNQRLRSIHTTATTLAGTIETLPVALHPTIAEADRLDRQYDLRLARIFEVVGALLKTTDDKMFRMTLLSVRRTLFPEGPLGETRSYLRQAGYVVVANMRMTIAMRDLLTAITYKGHTLLDDYDEWVRVGNRLGELESEWETLLEEHRCSGLLLPELRNLRISWQRWVEQLRYVARFSPNLGAEERVRLLQGVPGAENLFSSEERYGTSRESGETLHTG